MRMRRKPWARPELDASEVYIKNPHDYYENWQSAFDKEQPLVMELGCGKGGFISQKAFMHPEKNFIAFDIKSEVLAIAKRNIEAVYGSTHCPNVKITAFDIERIPLVVSPKDTVEEIYINFCNPWPKDRHAKRRLPSRQFLARFDQILKKEGVIEFKTDNKDLFTFAEEEVEPAGWKIIEITYDLHNDEKMSAGNIMTEYEEKFSSMGNPIYKYIISR